MTAIISIAGCVPRYSETPIATNFPTSSQEKLQAASHWKIITQDLSKRLQANLAGKINQDQAIYISAKDASEFNQATVAELISTLVAENYKVVKSSTNAIKIEVDTQVLSFSPQRLQAQRIGLPTAITTGLWAITELDQGITNSGVASALIIGADAQAYFYADRAKGPTPKTEIIINVSATDGDRYIAVSRSNYYVTDTDKWLYQAVQTKSFSVRGSN
jgi:hypothetical protein